MKKIATIVVIVALLLVLRHIGASIAHLIETEGTVRSLHQELQTEKKENIFLKQRLSYVKSVEFVEKEARERLGLVQENEYPVFVTPPSPTPSQKMSEETPNWKRWKKMFRL